VRCALPAGHTITKKDKTGASYSFTGQIGLTPQWETGKCDQTCQEYISACVLAHVNTSGQHIALWLDGDAPALGWGTSTDYPFQEGSFFGNIFTSPPQAYFCDGKDHALGVVPGRLGADQPGSPYTNPLGKDMLCQYRCTATGGSANKDGFTNCPAVSPTTGMVGYFKHVVTVYRNFDAVTKYKVCNRTSTMCLDVANNSTQAGAAIVQNPYSATDNGQKWIVTMVSPGMYKLVNVASGLALDLSGGKTTDGTQLTQTAFANTATQKWALKSMADGTGYFQMAPSSATGSAATIPNNGAAVANGPVQVAYYNYIDSQKWTLSLAN